MEHGLVELPGSHRQPLPNARRVADAPSEDEVLLTIVVRRKARAGERRFEPPSSSKAALPRAEMQERLADEAGADPADLEAVERYVTDAGMTVVSSDPARRTVAVRGTVAQASATFRVSLGRYEAEGTTYRGREG